MAPPKHPLKRQRIAFHQNREQALWRGEPWQLTWEEWWSMWEPYWPQRGREKGSVCMTRSDDLKPWHRDNVIIMDRQEFMRWRAQQPRAARGTRRQR